jgi:sulfur carrier protein
VQVSINGKRHELPADARVAAVLEVLGLPGRGVAVAVDGELVRRADWPTTPLVEGARVEVVTAVQGG